MRGLTSLVAVGLLLTAVSAPGEGVADRTTAGKPIPAWFTEQTGLGLFLHWGPWSAKFNSTCGWPQDEKLGLDEACRNEKYQYTPKDKTLAVKDVRKPKKVVLLRTGEEMPFGHQDNTLTVLIPAVKTTRLVDVARVEF